jgi:tRNA 2-selenouridine synthase
MRIPQEKFHRLLLSGCPLMDVRAPVEFAKGSLPHATNVPLLDDLQRHAIGLRYAEQGEAAAIQLGLELATPSLRQARLSAWQAFIEEHPNGALFCFRGGLRSQTTQQWLAAEGLHYPLIEGGYKALRRFLLEQFDDCIAQAPLFVLAGPTGSGKTEIIQQWPHSIDLEGLAEHRGSVFGETAQPQPAQIDWEHALILQWLRRRAISSAPVLIEDESRLIGRIFVPEPLQQRLRSGPQLKLLSTLTERIERLRQEFVLPLIARHLANHPQQGWAQAEHELQQSLQRIRKRLGGVCHDQLQQWVPKALQQVRQHQDYAAFNTFIQILLQSYYDPMYDYQMQRQDRPTLFTGNAQELSEWLLTQTGAEVQGQAHAAS